MSWSSLHHAAFDGSMHVTEALLSGRSVDIDRLTEDGLGFTPLALAAQEGHYSIVRVLLQNGARQRVRNDGGCTALIMSAIHGHERVAKLLMDFGAEIDASDCNGVTSLYSAALKGHFAVVKLLIEAGARVDIAASDGCTPLHPASMDGYLVVVKLLIEAGAPLDAKNREGSAAMHMAADQGHYGVVEALIEGGANPDIRMPRGQTPLFEAAFVGHTDIVKLLLRADVAAALPVSSPDGITGVALDVAAQNGHSDTVSELLRLGIAVCGSTNRGESALRLAAQNRRLGVMTMLTNAGVVDTGNALSYATDGGQEQSVKFLLRQEWATTAGREYVDHRNKFGLTPLLLSVWSASPRITRLLLDAGADETLPCRDYSRTGEHFGTPLAQTIRSLEKKTHRGERATEEELHGLGAIRRLLMRVEAVRASSWLWSNNISRTPPASEEADGAQIAVASTALSVPILWRRRRVRRAFGSAVVR